MSHLRLGIPSKGRLAEGAASLLQAAGLSFRRQDRSLFARVKEMPVDITFLRTDDIPTLCAEGAIDLGITGTDLVEEAEVEVPTRLALGMGKCRLAICVPEDSDAKSAADLNGASIATSFPNVTRNHLKKYGAEAHIVKLAGSVEVMVALGIAQGIVDLVETGSTLAANRLRVLEEIGNYETVIIQNPSSPHSEIIDRIVRRVEGVVIARGYSLLEYNVPQASLEQAEKVTPGFRSPTITPLEEKDWFSVRAMVRRKDVVSIMEQLESLGATAVLETPINNCRL